jgi:biopolymer transport protein ExbD
MAFDTSNANDEVMHEINMTPLVDVMLVLLVVFMITLPVVQQAVKVELPRVASAPNHALTDAVQLTVDAQGHYFLADKNVPADLLEDSLRTAAEKAPQLQLYIRGDKKVAYEQVAWAMTAAQRAGLSRIGFVTESRQP